MMRSLRGFVLSLSAVALLALFAGRSDAQYARANGWTTYNMPGNSNSYNYNPGYSYNYNQGYSYSYNLPYNYTPGYGLSYTPGYNYNPGYRAYPAYGYGYYGRRYYYNGY